MYVFTSDDILLMKYNNFMQDFIICCKR